MRSYRLAALVLFLSPAFSLAHGPIRGSLEDAVVQTDQAVLAKVVAIKETPKYHKLWHGGRGPLLTTQRDYTVEISRVLAGPDHKPGVVTYQAPICVSYNCFGQETVRKWIQTSGTGEENWLRQGQEYVLCLQGGGKNQSPRIVRAEPVDRVEAVTVAMAQAQCWAMLKIVLAVHCHAVFLTN
ncbi:MAG: hypothetical protein FWD53_07800 [Phycisphaerales bacterium]|nr:hypothetical protein [Phycisphaerales bacterium]